MAHQMTNTLTIEQIGQYEIVYTTSHLRDVLEILKNHDILSLDVETVGNESYELWTKAETLYPQVVESRRIADSLTKDCEPLRYERDEVSRQKRMERDLAQDKAHDLEKLYKHYMQTAQKSKSGLWFYQNELGCVQIGYEGLTYLIKPHLFTTDTLTTLQSILDKALYVIGHNIKFDIIQLKYHLGVSFTCSNLWDTMAAEYVLVNGLVNENTGKPLSLSLGETAFRRLGLELDKDISIRVANWKGDWTDRMALYGAVDVGVLFPIMKKQKEEFLNDPQSYNVFRNIECPLIPITADMELHGVGIDVSYLDRIVRVYEKLIQRHKRQVHNEFIKEGYLNPISSLNIDSPKQLLLALKSLGLELKDTNKKTLEKIKKHPVVSRILAYRKTKKLLSTYILPFRERVVWDEATKVHRIYCNFNQFGTRTGRYSSSDPNFQNLPSASWFRKVVIPAPGNVLIDGDTAGVEMRGSASRADCPVLKRAFQEGKDIHCVALANLSGRPYDELVKKVNDKEDSEYDELKKKRFETKTVQFSIVYGKTPRGLSEDLGISFMAAKGLLQRYFMSYRRVEKAIQTAIQFAKEHGYVRTLGGRRRFLPDIDEAKTIRRLIDKQVPNAVGIGKGEARKAERAAYNTEIQGGVGDGMKYGMIRLGRKHPLLLQVHDQVTLEVPKKDAEYWSGVLSEDLCWGMSQVIPDVPIAIGSEETGFKPVIAEHWGMCK